MLVKLFNGEGTEGSLVCWLISMLGGLGGIVYE